MRKDTALFLVVCAISTDTLNSDSDFRDDASALDEGLSVAMPYNRKSAVPPECTIVMAESSIPNAGWGVFSLETLKAGETLPMSSTADIVVHITDPNPLTAHGMKKVIWEYLWDGQEVGGQYEGQKVMSFAPGIGTLANGEATKFNVIPTKPVKDGAGLDRKTSPGAGAISHYHNLTWKVVKDITPGSEIFVNYGEGWFKERGYTEQPSAVGQRSTEWLRQNGYCLDNLVPGKSSLPHAGRGAFAKRDIEVGSVLAPVPVLPILSESLSMAKEHESTGRVVFSEQLLRNYCFGHRNSSLLLYPYSSMVNYINHASNGSPNVKLRWSEGSEILFSDPLSNLQLPHSRLLLELVATRSIKAGDELLLDYGKDWEDAWNQHVATWKPHLNEQFFMSSQDANDNEKMNGILQTALELQSSPYPDNLFTSCYYRVNLESNFAEPINERQVFEWVETRSLTQESRNLRPCLVVDRQTSLSGVTFYTVRIFNRPGLAPSERIPPGRPYIVTGVPGYAIEFSEKLYTSDQHLERAFRKEIGLDVFPLQWMDLS